jgi:hypothetical protein
MKVQGTKVAGFSAQNSKSNLAVPSINSARRENSSIEMNTASKDSTTQANTSRMPETTDNATDDGMTEVESVQPFQTPSQPIKEEPYYLQQNNFMETRSDVSSHMPSMAGQLESNQLEAD